MGEVLKKASTETHPLECGILSHPARSEKDKAAVDEQIGLSIWRVAEGVMQAAFIGVTGPMERGLESKEHMAADLTEAAKRIFGTTIESHRSPRFASS